MTATTHTPSANAVNWFEIPVANLARSSALYDAMLSTQLRVMDFGGVPHAVFPGERESIGALVADPKRPPRRGTGTLVFLNAPDGIARCVARAVEAGAKVVQPLTAIDPHGTIALIEDLDGNVIGLHEQPSR